MKKAVVAMFALAAVLLLMGCGEATVSSTGTSGGGSKPAAEAKTEFKVGEGIKVNEAVLTVVSAKQFTPTNEFDKPESGKVFYIVNMRIQNGGKTPVDYNEFNYKIQDANGVQKDAAFVGSEVPNKMNSGSLAAGGKIDANIVFQVPADMKSLKLIMEPNFFSKQQVTIVLTK
jgi:hypothetical protein